LTAATILALLKALPEVIALWNRIAIMADAATQRGLGRDQAVKEALQAATVDLEAANAARAEAEAAHNAHPNDDGGFDQEFQRK
jgi:hypothetical protein